MSNRFPSRGTRNRTGDGYSTSKSKRGGGMFRSEAVIEFNYDGFMSSLDSAKKELNRMLQNLDSLPDSKLVGSKQVSDIEVFGEWRKVIKYRVRDVAVRTTAFMKDEMLSNIGGRIETGTMKGSVKGRTDRSSQYGEVSRAGWLDTWYKYFGFQEEGTGGTQRSGPSMPGGNFGYSSQGIRPMNAVLKTVTAGRIFALKELSKMTRNLRSAGKGNVKRG